MPVRHSIIVFIVCLYSGAATVYAQEGYQVFSLTVTGNDSLETDMILNVMDTYGISAFEEQVLQKEPWDYSEEVLEQDLRSVRRLYQQEGFLDVSIGPVMVYSSREKRAVEIVLPIHEGAPVLVDSVSWNRIGGEGVDAARIDSVLRAAAGTLRLQPGMRFRDEALRLDAARIATTLADEGFAYARARYTLDLRRDENEVDIRWTVDAGPRCVFGPVRIEGDDRFPAEWVRQKLEFSEGDVYGSGTLERSRTAVYGLGLYRVVTIRTVKDSLKPRTIPVSVLVEEARPYRLSL